MASYTSPKGPSSENDDIRFTLGWLERGKAYGECWVGLARNTRLFKQRKDRDGWWIETYIELSRQDLQARCPRLLQSMLATPTGQAGPAINQEMALLSLAPVFASLYPELLDEPFAISQYSFWHAKSLWETALDFNIPLLARHASWIMIMRFKKHGGIPSNPLDSKGLSRVQIHALHLKALEAGHLDLAQLMGDAARKPPLHEIEQKVLRTLDYAGLIKLQNAREGQLAALLLQVVAAQYPSAYRDPWGCTCPGGNCQEIGCQQMRLKDMDVAVRDLCMLLDVHEEKDGHTRHWKLVYKDLSGNLVSDGR